MRFQGGTSTGKRRAAEQPFQRQPAGAQLAQHQHGRPLRARVRSSCFAGRGVIDVGVAMLQQVDARLAGQTGRPAPGSRAPARRRAPAARRVSRWSRAAGRAPARHRRHRRRATTARPCGRPRASARPPRRGPAQLLMTNRRCSSAAVVGAAIDVARREAAQRRAGQGPADGVGQAVGRQRARRHHGHHAALGQQRRAIGLLGLARRAERHQHGTIGAAQGLDGGVVAGLGDRQRRVASSVVKSAPRRLDDDPLPSPWRARRGPAPACSRRPAVARSGRPAPSCGRAGDGGLEQRRADGAAAHRDDDFVLAFGALASPCARSRSAT